MFKYVLLFRKFSLCLIFIILNFLFTWGFINDIQNYSSIYMHHKWNSWIISIVMRRFSLYMPSIQTFFFFFVPMLGGSVRNICHFHCDTLSLDTRYQSPNVSAGPLTLYSWKLHPFHQAQGSVDKRNSILW